MYILHTYIYYFPGVPICGPYSLIYFSPIIHTSYDAMLQNIIHTQSPCHVTKYHTHTIPYLV
jgi:hypothetical protein